MLRVYWYDAPPRNAQPSAQQIALANLDHIKLRLGLLNINGQQKGVDSLIVTDLVELARHGAISDALLLSGDEDVRIGVQIAQSLGVRIHLLGITPARGSQSHSLMQEADTCTEWTKEDIAKFLSIRPEISAPAAAPSAIQPTISATHSQQGIEAAIKQAIEDVLVGFTATDFKELQAFWDSGERGVPAEWDGKLLGKTGVYFGSQLDGQQKPGCVSNLLPK